MQGIRNMKSSRATERKPGLSPLVVHANVHILLTRRDHLTLLFPLQLRQLLHRLADDVQSLLDLLLGNDQRRSQADNVLMSGLGLFTC